MQAILDFLAACHIKMIWIVFALIFAFLCRYHYRQARMKMPYLELRAGSVDGIKIVKGLDEFHEYIDACNKNNRSQNNAASLGYFAAFWAAIFSACIS